MATDSLEALQQPFSADILTAIRLAPAIQQCREGKPLPLIRELWPKIRLDDFQVDAIESLFNPKIREVFIKGNTGCGKTAIAGIAVCLYFQVFDDARIVLTRDKFDTAKKILFGECVSWWKRMRFTLTDAVVLANEIYDPNNREGHYVLIANPKTPEGFQGVHSPHVLHVYDEATADVLQPRYKLSSTQATSFLAMGNPRVTSGEFYRAFPKGRENETHTFNGPNGRRRLITVDGEDCLNVRKKCLKKSIAPMGGIIIDGREYKAGEDIEPEDFKKASPIIPGQTCFDEYIALLANPDPDFVACYAHGKFPEADTEVQLFVRKWISHVQQQHSRFMRLLERAEKDHTNVFNWLLNKRLPVEAFGLDVAASEVKGDWSVLTAGGRHGVRKQHRTQKANVMRTTAWTIKTIRDEYGIDITDGNEPICIDYGGGYGRGVGDRLEELGAFVIKFVPNATSEINPKKYKNLRVEAYAELANRLDPDAIQAGEVSEELLERIDAEKDDSRILRMPDFLLPESNRLFEDLAVLEKIYDSDAFKFNLTPKRTAPGHEEKIESIEKRLGRSPDDGDSVSYMFHALPHIKDSLSEWLDAGAF